MPIQIDFGIALDMEIKISKLGKDLVNNAQKLVQRMDEQDVYDLLLISEWLRTLSLTMVEISEDGNISALTDLRRCIDGSSAILIDAIALSPANREKDWEEQIFGNLYKNKDIFNAHKSRTKAAVHAILSVTPDKAL